MNMPPTSSPANSSWAEHCRQYGRLMGRASLSLDDLDVPESVCDKLSIYSVANYFTDGGGSHPYAGAPLSFNSLSDENCNPSRASSIVTEPSIHSEPATRSESQLLTWREAIAESYIPPTLPSFAQSTPQLRHRPVEYHPPPTEYAPYHPPDEDPDEEVVLKLDTYRNYTTRVCALESFLKAHPQHENAVAVPVIVWRDPQECDVLSMRTRPRYVLEVGDHFESFGLISGDWRITNQVERSKKWYWKGKRWHCEEHVYVVCQDDNALYQTWVKMPASYFYPPPLAKRVKASLKKIGSLFTPRFRNLSNEHPSIRQKRYKSHVTYHTSHGNSRANSSQYGAGVGNRESGAIYKTRQSS
ncbi:hypothetical protein DFH06DRAFT_1140309 [Mycena polygramma]|nr:hypothetical protein DFH06DRAFT_1140309 [Mycena polygramma]